jgi:flavin-dependent dehydrogenase
LAEHQVCGAPAKPVDVLVYGATAGGTMAAIAAAKQGASVLLLEPCRSLNSKRTLQILRCFKD